MQERVAHLLPRAAVMAVLALLPACAESGPAAPALEPQGPAQPALVTDAQLSAARTADGPVVW